MPKWVGASRLEAEDQTVNTDLLGDPYTLVPTPSASASAGGSRFL